MKPNIKEFYDKIEIGKDYDFWTFAGIGSLITIREDDVNSNNIKTQAENKGWAWFLYKDAISHPLHRRLMIIEKGYRIEIIEEKKWNYTK